MFAPRVLRRHPPPSEKHPVRQGLGTFDVRVGREEWSCCRFEQLLCDIGITELVLVFRQEQRRGRSAMQADV
jgi:hypothetical protein